MRKFILRINLQSRKRYTFKPNEEMAVLNDLFNRFVNEEKYELAAIVKERIDILKPSEPKEL